MKPVRIFIRPGEGGVPGWFTEAALEERATTVAREMRKKGFDALLVHDEHGWYVEVVGRLPK